MCMYFRNGDTYMMCVCAGYTQCDREKNNNERYTESYKGGQDEPSPV